MAFRVCKDIGCPHPNQFEKFGIGIGELMDWWAYYLYLNDRDEEDAPSDKTKMEALARMKAKCGA